MRTYNSLIEPYFFDIFYFALALWGWGRHCSFMLDRAAPLPDDPARLKGMVESLAAKLQAREEALRSRAEALKARDILIEKLRHELAGMRRHRFGARSEALAQLQLALENEEIARAASPPPQPEPAAARAPRRKRRPLPDRLPRRETVLEPGSACGACGGAVKTVGADVTEELEYIPGRFVVNRIVRPRTVCRACACFRQAPLPPRPIERGRPGPGLRAHVPVSKYADHLPLYRQAQMFARDGIDLDRSTLAEWVGKSAALPGPVANGIGNHVRAGGAIFADDTTVRLQTPRGAGARGKTRTARLWVYARDERPWRGTAPPAACYRFSANRKGENPRRHLAGFKGWMHADGYAGFAELYRTGRIREAPCMAHVRRKFVDLARNRGAPVAREAVERIAALYAVEAEARGQTPEERVRIRQAKARHLLNGLETWLARQSPNISARTPLAGAIRYARARLARLRPRLDNGTLELDNNTAERAIRGIALGRKNWLFVGSEAGGATAATAYTLIETAKLNGIDPRAWIADTLNRIQDYKTNRIHELMPWNWKHKTPTVKTQ